MLSVLKCLKRKKKLENTTGNVECMELAWGSGDQLGCSIKIFPVGPFTY